MAFIECDNLVKIYKVADIEVVALQGLDFEVEQGEVMAIIGNSGSGKSTLLNMLGGLDRPSAGKLFVDGHDLLKIKGHELVKYKRRTVGFVWQNNARNLVPYLTVQENIELPMLVNGKVDHAWAAELIDRVGLNHRRKSKLSELSGGEQQRTAIAIGLANHPKLLLADEPTGNVDTTMAKGILMIFNELSRDLGLTVVIVTHDRMVSKLVNRVVSIRDGKTSSEMFMRKNYLEELDTAGWGDEAEKVDIEESHDEYAILDKAGRLQIQPQYIEAIGGDAKTRHMKINVDGERLILTLPPKDDSSAEHRKRVEKRVKEKTDEAKLDKRAKLKSGKMPDGTQAPEDTEEPPADPPKD